MVNWSSGMARKYDILQQDANTRAMTGAAAANLDRARAAGMPSLTRSQAGLNDATARLTGVRADLAPGIAGSEIGLNRANAFRQRALGETAYDQNLPQIDLMRGQAGNARASAGLAGVQGQVLGQALEEDSDLGRIIGGIRAGVLPQSALGDYTRQRAGGMGPFQGPQVVSLSPSAPSPRAGTPALPQGMGMPGGGVTFGGRVTSSGVQAPGIPPLPSMGMGLGPAGLARQRGETDPQYMSTQERARLGMP